jgi:GNAT superfamily N-acetyltransferase
MELKVIKTELKEIQALRTLFLHENNFQFTYDKCHLYGWADTYLFMIDDVKAGYGSVWGKEKREDRDSIFEFYMTEPHRKFADAFFKGFHTISGATFVECQSNDLLLTTLLFQYTEHIGSEAILFEDSFQTDFFLREMVLQKKLTESNENSQSREYELLKRGELVASGGMMLNYNMPYADLYYGVEEKHRRKGFGTYLLQELKKEAYRMGRVPAARCNINNAASKATLLKAGFKVCGFRLYGQIRKQVSSERELETQ